MKPPGSLLLASGAAPAAPAAPPALATLAAWTALTLPGCGGGAPGAAGEASAADFLPYQQVIPGSEQGFDMVPIAGGQFTMGCPTDEPGAGPGESPPHEVQVSPFWMAAREVRWDEYRLFQFRQLDAVDGVTGPTPPYVPMDFGMGVEGFPAIAMTHYAARQYCKWLTLKTGRFHRLPTEAEWEYACRAGSRGPYSFGDGDAQAVDDAAGGAVATTDALGEHAWYYGNAEDGYREVGTRAPNAFGLYDMHGNVAEWVADGFDAQEYARRAEAGAAVVDPVVWPTEEWGRVVRGGSWFDDPERLRSAARRASVEAWKAQDPQRPKSIWYLTDARWVGFRVVRPLVPPPRAEWERWWEADVPAIAEIQARQARGER